MFFLRQKCRESGARKGYDGGIKGQGEGRLSTKSKAREQESNMSNMTTVPCTETDWIKKLKDEGLTPEIETRLREMENQLFELAAKKGSKAMTAEEEAVEVEIKALEEEKKRLEGDRQPHLDELKLLTSAARKSAADYKQKKEEAAEARKKNDKRWKAKREYESEHLVEVRRELKEKDEELWSKRRELWMLRNPTVPEGEMPLDLLPAEIRKEARQERRGRSRTPPKKGKKKAAVVDKRDGSPKRSEKRREVMDRK